MGYQGEVGEAGKTWNNVFIVRNPRHREQGGDGGRANAKSSFGGRS